MSISSISGASQAQSLFAKIDADGDGKVTKDEFVASRPKDISEDQAAELYAKIDSEGTGALTEDQLKAGLDANRPPPPPELSGGSASLSSDTLSALLEVLQQQSESSESDASTTTASTDTTSSQQAPVLGADALNALVKAIESYAAANNITLDETGSTVNSIG